VSSDKELMSRAAATAARVLAEQWPDDRAIVGIGIGIEIEIEDVGDLYFLHFLVSARRDGVRVRRTGELMGAPCGTSSDWRGIRSSACPGRAWSRTGRVSVDCPTGPSSAAPRAPD
jgi:hypothetical protein